MPPVLKKNSITFFVPERMLMYLQECIIALYLRNVPVLWKMPLYCTWENESVPARRPRYRKENSCTYDNASVPDRMFLYLNEFPSSPKNDLCLRDGPCNWQNDPCLRQSSCSWDKNAIDSEKMTCTWEIAGEGEPVYLRICRVPETVSLFLRKCSCQENAHVRVPERHPCTWETPDTVSVRMALQELWQ